MSISANGSSNGILWTLQTGGTRMPGILHAHDAIDPRGPLRATSGAFSSRPGRGCVCTAHLSPLSHIQGCGVCAASPAP